MLGMAEICGGLLTIEVMKVEVMIGLENLAEQDEGSGERE